MSSSILKYKDLAIGMVLREISLAKNNLITVLQNFETFIPAIRPCSKWRMCSNSMTGGKSSKMLMDFDDLLVNAYQLLKSDDHGPSEISGNLQASACGRISGYKSHSNGNPHAPSSIRQRQ